MGASENTRFRRGRVAAAVGLLIVALPAVIGEWEAVAAPPTVNCDTDANVFNTGYDAATGTFFVDGKPDANWEVAGPFAMTNPVTKTSLPPADAAWAPSIVGKLAGNWSASPFGNAQWISKEGANADKRSPSGDWYYRYQFTIDPAVDASAFSLQMSFLADNAVVEVFINDVAQSSQTTGLPQNPPANNPYYLYGFQYPNASKTVLNHNWRTGANTMIVQIKSGAPYEGFLAQMRPSTLCPQPAIQLKKTVSPNLVQAAGTKVKYSFELTNIGNQPLTDVTVTEAGFSGKGGAPAVSCPKSVLAVEEVMTCSAEYTVTEEDYAAAKQSPNRVSEIANTATASGTPPNGPAVTSKPAGTTLKVAYPGLRIVKATTKAFVTAVGEQVPYTFTVTNTAPLLVAQNVTVTDPKVGAVTCPAPAAARLTSGKSMECTGTYTVTQADLDGGRITNTATASGAVGNKTISEESNEVVVPVLHHPGLSVVKASTTTNYRAVGQVIPYTFRIVNVGNVTLHDVGLSDPKVQDQSCPLDELGPGEGTMCSGSYTVTQQDLNAGLIANRATASGLTPGNVDVGATSNVHVIGAQASPQIAIVKSTETTYFDKVGQGITWAFVVTNTGNQDVTDIRVTDPIVTGSCTIPRLAPGEWGGCTISRPTTAAELDAGRITNVATAAGTSPNETAVTAESNRVVVPAVHHPQLTMVKSSTSETLEGVGTKVPYEFRVINTGNVTVENVKITDGRVTDLSCPATKLAPGERMTCTAGNTLIQADLDAGQVVNQATVDGDIPAGGRKLGPTPSNEVIIRRAASEPPTIVQGAQVQPGVAGLPNAVPAPVPAPEPAPSGQLPRTGLDVTVELRTALFLLVTGVALWAAGRRRSGRAWPVGSGR